MPPSSSLTSPSSAVGTRGPHIKLPPTTPAKAGPHGAAEGLGYDDLRSYQRIVILTEGHSRPESAKTAIQLLRYRPEDIAAVLDSEHSGSTAHQVFGVGGDIPCLGRLADVKDADAVFLGIAPPGGRLPESWVSILLEALQAGLPVVSGMHDALSEHPRLAAAAGGETQRLIDLRSRNHRRIATVPPRRHECVRVLTVGSDCCVGKMSAAKEIELGLRRRGRDAAFIATGQTGLMIGGAGVVIDSVVSDFVNGVIEQLVVEHENHELVIVEGQGSIAHPAYSAVSAGLLHGAAPDAMVLCHELGREHLKSAPHVPIEKLTKLVELHETLGGVRHPGKVVGLALNGRRLAPEAAAEQIETISLVTGLPACDVYRDGPDRLLDAIEDLDRSLRTGRAPETGVVAD